MPTYFTTQTETFFDANTGLVTQYLFSFLATGISNGTCISNSPTAQGCRCSHYPGDCLTRQPGKMCQALGNPQFERGNVPKCAHIARHKSRNVIGSLFWMKKDSPAAVRDDTRFSIARIWASATLLTWVMSHKLSPSPMRNGVSYLAIHAWIGGISWQSPGPQSTDGRRAHVAILLLEALRTSASAAAYQRCISICFHKLGIMRMCRTGECQPWIPHRW